MRMDEQTTAEADPADPTFTVAECVKLAREIAEWDAEECFRRLTLSGRYNVAQLYRELREARAGVGGAR